MAPHGTFFFPIVFFRVWCGSPWYFFSPDSFFQGVVWLPMVLPPPPPDSFFQGVVWLPMVPFFVFPDSFFQGVVWLPIVPFSFFPHGREAHRPNLDLQFFTKIHFLDEVIVFDHLPCKGLSGYK